MNYKLLRNLVRAARITCIEELVEYTGISADDIEEAFAEHCNEYEEMKKDMNENHKYWH